jgi:hypothetical protein
MAQETRIRTDKAEKMQGNVPVSCPHCQKFRGKAKRLDKHLNICPKRPR